MLAETEPIATAADGWLAQFEEALAHPGDLLERLFHRDSYWRDVLALTWRIRTMRGSDTICDELRRMPGRSSRVSSGLIPIGRAPPGDTRRDRRARSHLQV